MGVLDSPAEARSFIRVFFGCACAAVRECPVPVIGEGEWVLRWRGNWSWLFLVM